VQYNGGAIMKLAITVDTNEYLSMLKNDRLDECILKDEFGRTYIYAKKFRELNIKPDGDDDVLSLYNIICSVGAEDLYQIIVELNND